MGRRPVGSRGRGRGADNRRDNTNSGEATGDTDRPTGLKGGDEDDGSSTSIVANGTSKSAGRDSLAGLVHYGTDSDDDSVGERTSLVPLASEATSQDHNNALDNDVSNNAELPLPKDWQQCIDHTGAIYYWNTRTDETSWDRPSAAESCAESGTEEMSSLQGGTDHSEALNSTVPQLDDAEHHGSDATSDTASEEEDEGDTSLGQGSTQASPTARETTSNGSVSQAEIQRGPGKLSSIPETKKEETAESEIAGVDDLLAGIEKEFLSDDTADCGQVSALDEQDFSTLRGSENRLEDRASEAYRDLRESLQRVGISLTTDISGSCRRTPQLQAAELSAVLRARLSDWHEGGLNGDFFVSRLEEMADQAKRFTRPIPAKAISTAEAQMKDSSSTPPSGATILPADRKCDKVDDRDLACREKEDAPDEGKKGTMRSKRKRRLMGAPLKSSATLFPVAFTAAAEEGMPVREVTLAKNVDIGDPDVKRIEAAEKMRWADEVSAAATAAVAAAAAAAAAKKVGRKEQETEKGSDGLKESGRDRDKGGEAVDEEGEDGGRGAPPRNGGNRTTTSIIASEEQEREASRDGDDNTEVDTGGLVVKTGWAAVWDETHRAYYYHNLATDETTWEPQLSSERNTFQAITSGVDSDNPERRGKDDEDVSEVIPEAMSSVDPASSVASEERKRDELQQVDDSVSHVESGASKKQASTRDAECARAKPATSSPASGQTSDTPVEQPSPWRAVWDEDQRAYYYHNTITDETIWELPTEHPISCAAASEVPEKEEGEIALDKSPARPDLTVAEPTPAADAASTSGELPTSSGGSGDISPDEAVMQSTSSSADLLRSRTLIWWSDAGDVWDGPTLSGLLSGFGPRTYRNLGAGYYMTTLQMGSEWAAAAAATLGQGFDPASAARSDWVACTASAPCYGLFLRWARDDDEQKLFDTPAESYDDPSPTAALTDNVDTERSTQEDGGETARRTADKTDNRGVSTPSSNSKETARRKGKSSSNSSTGEHKKRKSGGMSKGTGGTSTGSIGKKRKGAATLIDKWKAIASTAGEEAEKEAERQEKLERWKARAAAQDPDNPNFMPLGRRR